jgi:hypothetical protein
MDGGAACRTYPVQWSAQYVTLQNISLFRVYLIPQKKLEFKNQVQKSRFKIYLIIQQFVAKIIQILWYGPGIT